MKINEQRLIEKFIELAKISSPSLREREIADFLIQELKDLGLEVYEDNAGKKYGGNAGNVVGILKGASQRVLFSAHMDTVSPCENVEPVIENGRIFTRGNTILGGDDKIGIAAILEMLKVIVENSLEHPTIIVVFSIAEEIRLLGATELDVSNLDIDFGFILDSNGKPGTVVKEAPFHDEIKLEFIGKSAHAGIQPEAGINAFYIASKAISRLKMGRIDYETTFNIGMVKGGVATNIVMEKLEIVGEARSISEKKLGELVENVIEICQNTCEEYGAKLNYKIHREYDGFSFSEDNKLLKLVEKSANNLGLKYEAQSIGGGSDVNVYILKGVNTVNLGIGMSKVHTCDEYVELKDLEDITKLLLELTKEI